MIYLTSDNIEADHVWVIGDKTLLTIKPQREDLKDSYIVSNFKIVIATETDEVRTPSVLARLYNAIVKQFVLYKHFPKWIIIITEADVITALPQVEVGTSELYGKSMNWIMSALEKLLANTFMNKNVAQLLKRPRILWVEPTLHINYEPRQSTLRRKFIRSMHIVTKAHPSAITLSLKQGWNEFDRSICLNRTRRIADGEGVKTFWRAMDNTIKYADTKVNRSTRQPLDLLFNKFQIQQDMERRLKWSLEAENMRRDWHAENGRGNTNVDTRSLNDITTSVNTSNNQAPRRLNLNTTSNSTALIPMKAKIETRNKYRFAALI